MKEVTLTHQNFKQEVLEASGYVLVDFWAEWCGPCKMLAPIVEELAEEDNGVKVCKVNVDDQAELSGVFGISSIPTLVLFKDGKPVKTHIGYAPKSEIEKLWK